MHRFSIRISALLLAMMVSIPTISVSQAFDAAAVATRLKELGIKPNNHQEPTPETVASANLIAIREARDLTDADIAMIAAMPRLDSLILGHPDVIRSDRLRVLMASPRLTRINFFRQMLSDEAMAIVATAQNLNAVDLREAKGISAIGLASLARLPKLSHLWLNSADVSEEGFAAFSGHPSLQRLTLTRTRGLTDAVLDHLGRMPKLQYLGLEQTGVTLAGLSRLKNAANFISLELNGLAGTSADSAALAAFYNLRELSVQDTAVDDALAEVLSKLHRLTLLDVSRTRIGDATIAAVRGHQELRVLRIIGTSVSDAAFRGVVWPQLRFIHAARTKITDAVLSDVVRQPNLHQLYAEHTAVTKEAIARELAQRPAGMPTLRITN